MRNHLISETFYLKTVILVVLIELAHSQTKDLRFCMQRNDPGPCKASIPRWYYSPQQRNCHKFEFGGCAGNENNFRTKEECLKVCCPIGSKNFRISPFSNFEQQYDPEWSDYEQDQFNSNSEDQYIENFSNSEDICRQELIVGGCRALFARFYFDQDSARCKPFFYSGCGENQNNFKSFSECNQVCGGGDGISGGGGCGGRWDGSSGGVSGVESQSRDVCGEQLNPGRCKAGFVLWYFEQASSKCKPFIGCKGNGNKFDSRDECEETCGVESVGSPYDSDRFGFAELNTYEEFKETNSGKDVAEYAVDLGFKSFDLEFKKFKIKYNRNYGSEEEEERRKFNFLKTIQFIEKHNSLYKRGEVTHEVGVNDFADLTTEEFDQIFSMPIPRVNLTQVQRHYKAPTGLPASFNWRAKGKVTRVKHQGSCGSCWAFATTAMVESSYLIDHNQQVLLSEQQMVDCFNTSCKGYNAHKALIYVKNHGLESEIEYPYQGYGNKCRTKPSRVHYKIRGHKKMCKGAGQGICSDEEIMNSVFKNGPVGFMMDPSGRDFHYYKGGILSTGVNEWKQIHMMTIVGWAPDYWIVKNSWGTGWGEKGFIKMARGKNLRGINEITYAII